MIRQQRVSQMNRLSLIAEFRLHRFTKVQRFSAAHRDDLQPLARRPSGNIGPGFDGGYRAEGSPRCQLLLISRHRVQSRVLRLAQIGPEDHRPSVIGSPLHFEVVVDTAVAEPALPAAHRHPRFQFGRRPVAVRHHHQRAILQHPQQRPIRRQPQRPCPVILRLVGWPRLGREPAERFIEGVQREIDHQLRSPDHPQVLSQSRKEERARSLNFVDSRKDGIDAIAAVLVGEDLARHGEIGPEQLHHGARLWRAPAVPHQPRQAVGLGARLRPRRAQHGHRDQNRPGDGGTSAHSVSDLCSLACSLRFSLPRGSCDH